MITLTLTTEEVNGILTVLGDLPTKSRAYPLVVKIQEQASPQIKETENVGNDSVAN